MANFHLFLHKCLCYIRVNYDERIRLVSNSTLSTVLLQTRSALAFNSVIFGIWTKDAINCDNAKLNLPQHKLNWCKSFSWLTAALLKCWKCDNRKQKTPSSAWNPQKKLNLPLFNENKKGNVLHRFDVLAFPFMLL